MFLFSQMSINNQLWQDHKSLQASVNTRFSLLECPSGAWICESIDIYVAFRYDLLHFLDIDAMRLTLAASLRKEGIITLDVSNRQQ